MAFSSLLFIYLFLPANLLCYAFISDVRKKNLCILIFSLLFYSWTSPFYLILLVCIAVINYLGALWIDKNRETLENNENKKWYRKPETVLVVDLSITLGFLCYFKYFSVYPVGISFYSFQLISYVIDVYRKDIKAERKFLNVLLFTALFHQCIAGPIVKYRDIAKDLNERKTSIDSMSYGISRFCYGLAKKVILADSCASILTNVFPSTLQGVENATVLAAWFGSLLYMLEIYLDFSAYSDMAIGLGKMTGFNYKENFRYPYMSQSVSEFWRRWHISLGTFFREYLYIPLGGNRKGLRRQVLNMLVVWALTGMWHGATYNFLLWGLYYFVLLVLEKIFILKLFGHMNNIVGAVIKHIYTLTTIFFGWIIFRFQNFEILSAAVRSLFGLNGNSFTNMETNTVIMNNFAFVIVCILLSTSIAVNAAGWMKKKAEECGGMFLSVYNCFNVVLPAVMLILSTAGLVGNSYNPFIYYRF